MGKSGLRQLTASLLLREIVEYGPKTRYRIAKDSDVDASQLLRFVHGRGKLTTDTLDRVGKSVEIANYF